MRVHLQRKDSPPTPPYLLRFLECGHLLGLPRGGLVGDGLVLLGGGGRERESSRPHPLRNIPVVPRPVSIEVREAAVMPFGNSQVCQLGTVLFEK